MRMYDLIVVPVRRSNPQTLPRLAEGGSIIMLLPLR